MKNIVLIILLAITALISCKQEQDPIQETKTALSNKKKELATLTKEISELKAELEKIEPKKEKIASPVGVYTVKPVHFEKFTTVQGSVQADASAYVSSETGGRLTSIKAKEGDYIRRGQLVATVDLSSLKTQMAEVETRMSLAKTVYNKQRRLWEQNIGTEIQYLQAKNNVEQLESSLNTMKSQLAKANVYAPMSGYVEMELVKNGEVVGPGTPILQIVNNSRVKVVADVPESFLGVIKKGQKVEVNFPAINKTITKRVTMLGRQINPSNRTFKVEVATTNPNKIYKPNLLSELKFKSFEKKGAVTLDLPVILEEVTGKQYVFIVATQGGKKVAQKRYVKTGESANGKIVVTEGLDTGDVVITEGARRVNENDPVTPSNN